MQAAGAGISGCLDKYILTVQFIISGDTRDN